MSIGIILLSADGCYVSQDGSLPTGRPVWDKPFLLDLCTNSKCICSQATYDGLPPSLKRLAKAITITKPHVPYTEDFDVNLGIGSFATDVAVCDTFIIVRTPDIINGKVFDTKRLEESYKLTTKLDKIEFWSKI